MTVARLVPFAELNLFAQVDSSGHILGFVDNKGSVVQLAVANSAGQIATAAGASTAFRSDVVPVNSVVPAIAGAGTVGVSHTADHGTFTGADNVYTYQWKLGGVAIVGAVAAAYTPLVGQVDGVITVTVTATNPAGAASATSTGVTVIAA